MLCKMRIFSGAVALGMACLLSVGIADLTVTVKPVRYCSSTWFGLCNGRSYPWGNYWENAGVSGNDQDKIFMAYLSSPPARAAVRNIVFLTSGQQGSSGGADENNVVSGYKSGWSWNTKKDGQRSRSLEGESLAIRFHGEKSVEFPTSNTVFITVANSMFNHLKSSSTKEKFLTAYANFLGSHIYWSNVEKIYFAGSSRGGCLVARLAKKLMDDPSIDAKFSVNTVDGVCKYTQDEFGTTSSTIDNPNSPNSTFKNFKGYKTNISNQVADKQQMCMKAVVGGQEVTNVGLGVRAFTHETCHSSSGCTLNDSNGDQYYKQTWHDIDHTDFGRNYNYKAVTVQGFLDHYENVCKVKFAPPTPVPTPPPTPPPIGPIKPVKYVRQKHEPLFN